MVALTINTSQYNIDVDPDMPLLWAIRDHVDLTGTKFGCGIAPCGACTVHHRRAAGASCQTQVGDVAGKQITTIEGLDGRGGRAPCRPPGASSTWSSAATASPARSCRPSASWRENPKPTDADIDSAMDGNICRCGTYQRIRAAIHDAARDLA